MPMRSANMKSKLPLYSLMTKVRKAYGRHGHEAMSHVFVPFPLYITDSHNQLTSPPPLKNASLIYLNHPTHSLVQPERMQHERVRVRILFNHLPKVSP
jgi:hypothetical protein